jgi:thermostable 8-oxoguanine DNA glycosylase
MTIDVVGKAALHFARSVGKLVRRTRSASAALTDVSAQQSLISSAKQVSIAGEQLVKGIKVVICDANRDEAIAYEHSILIYAANSSNSQSIAEIEEHGDALVTTARKLFEALGNVPQELEDIKTKIEGLINAKNKDTDAKPQQVIDGAKVIASY